MFFGVLCVSASWRLGVEWGPRFVVETCDFEIEI